MLKRRLGREGPEVSAVGLGLVPLSLPGRPSEADAVRVIHAALDAGITLIDTADAYCVDDGETGYGERLVKRALDEWGSRKDVLVATKGGHVRPNGAWETDASPGHLRAACEASLRALGTDSIGLYQLHKPDPRVYFADSIGELHRLRGEGKIRHIGLSNVDVGHIEAARGITHIASVQNSAGPFDRRAYGNGVVEACERHGLAFIAYSPVGGHGRHQRVGGHGGLRAIAARYDATPYEIVLAWLLTTSPVLLAIPGASREASARSSARAADLALSPADREKLERLFPAPSFLVRQLVSVRRRVRTLVREVRRSS